MAMTGNHRGAMRPPTIPASRYKPYPEFLDRTGGSYSIVNSDRLPGAISTGMTDKVNRVLYVPLEEEGIPVSFHEMMHVWLSPRSIKYEKLRVPQQFVWAMEDARINMAAAHVELPITFGERLAERILRQDLAVLVNGDIAAFTLRAVAGLGTSSEEPTLTLLDVVDGAPAELIRKLVAGTKKRLEKVRHVRGDIAGTFEDGMNVARWLARQLAKHGYELPSDPGKQAVMGCCAHAEDHEKMRERYGAGADAIGGGIRPGIMKISKPVLRHRCELPDGYRGRRKRAASTGTEICGMERYVTDQKIFGRRVRQRGPSGGSVLVDVSGSMHLSTEDIDRIIVGSPLATTVALYSGKGEQGELRVVVRNGYRASPHDLEPYAEGNVVDIPALEWLASQPEPRVWLSDGGVTGCGDTPTKEIHERCMELCEDGAILRAETAEEKAEILAGRSSGEPPPPPPGGRSRDRTLRRARARRILRSLP